MVDLCLGDAGEVILDRVFDGDDFDLRTIDLLEKGIERCRLSRARRTSEEDHAVWLFDLAHENVEHWWEYPEIFETDARFQSQSQRLENIDHVYGFLSDVIGTRTTAYWLEVFDKADIPAARMYAIQDILADEHVRATGFVRKVDHPTQGELQITAIPTEWSESVPENRLHAPDLGENTREVLAEFGYSEAEIDQLHASGAAGAPSRIANPIPIEGNA